MGEEHFTVEQIIILLREVDVKLSHRQNVRQICREMGITEQSYYRYRMEYGKMKAALVNNKIFKRNRETKR
ncbi:MAG TPA: transposase [Syntrophales bacterium]|jgi:hypothetical protein|nr:transposase [Syntrophales bacterium]HPI58463.1 transposase [Syntrophales bacterium]HPN25963.1 transposase [Syntrophales bacterium]HQM28801.1 transposase [Syntrophales bacterium]